MNRNVECTILWQICAFRQDLRMGRGTGTKFFILLWKNLIIKVGTRLNFRHWSSLLSSPEAALADVNTGGDFEALYFFILLIIPLTHHKLYFLSITLPYQLTHHVWQTTFYECIGARAHHSVCGHRGASHRGRRSSESKVCLTFPKTHCFFAHNSLLKILETSPCAITSIEVVFTVLWIVIQKESNAIQRRLNILI